MLELSQNVLYIRRFPRYLFFSLVRWGMTNYAWQNGDLKVVLVKRSLYYKNIHTTFCFRLFIFIIFFI